MQVKAIQNYGITTPRIEAKNSKQSSAMQQVSFGSNEDNSTNGSKAMKNLIYGLMMLGAASTAGTLTGCDDGYAEAYAKAEATASAEVTITTTIDSLKACCNCHPDTVVKWYYGFDRPIPLDTLFNNMKNWGVDGADGKRCDPNAKRNIIHYEGTREWEYGSKEIGDINLTEIADRRVLIYDTEVKDYKGNHESYGKRVFRVPTTSFYLKRKNGEEIFAPKGLFVEEYENPFDTKGASILDCKLKTRTFVQTNGDTLNVAKIADNVFVETGKVAKGYLGANSILLKNLIGRYDTEDHYVDFTVEAVNDEDLRKKYVLDMDFKTSQGGNGDGNGNDDGTDCVD